MLKQTVLDGAIIWGCLALPQPFRQQFHQNKTQIVSKSKCNPRKYSMFIAETNGGNESNSWKISSFNGTPNASIQKSLTNLYHEKENVTSGDSHHKYEEGPNYLSFDRQELSEQVKYLVNLLEKLKAIHLLLLASERWNVSQLKCHRVYSASATNLTHYLALQGLDVRQLNDDLSSIGLMNLESINSHVLASINVGIFLLENLISGGPISKEITRYMQNTDCIVSQEGENIRELSINSMNRKASSNAAALFGPSQEKRASHIMVTIGREVISNEMLLTDLLNEGANVIRINCAHDSPTEWSEIIRIARHSSELLEKPCRILMDLAGPKLRTDVLLADQNLIEISPKKETTSGTVFPAQIWLCCAGSCLPADQSADAILCVEQKFLNKLKDGNVISLIDVRGKKISLKLRMGSLLSNSGYMAECSQSAYIGSDTELCIKKRNKKHFTGKILNMPAFVESVMLKPGEPVAFDDGKIWGRIQVKNVDEISILITHANPNGSKLESKKSINIPDSEVLLKGLTSKDLEDLDFIASNADMVGISFLRDVDDMIMVQNELEKRGLQKLGTVLKIETREAFNDLPLLLFQAMQSSNPLGVMIARGDLMVECGWDKMAHIQEEILSICNAAQVPVIWATRVLESLIKFGLPTRAEITDVVGGMRASCVMLNKGEYIVEAVAALDSILCNRVTKNVKKITDPPGPSIFLDQ